MAYDINKCPTFGELGMYPGGINRKVYRRVGSVNTRYSINEDHVSVSANSLQLFTSMVYNPTMGAVFSTDINDLFIELPTDITSCYYVDIAQSNSYQLLRADAQPDLAASPYNVLSDLMNVMMSSPVTIMAIRLSFKLGDKFCTIPPDAVVAEEGTYQSSSKVNPLHLSNREYANRFVVDPINGYLYFDDIVRDVSLANQTMRVRNVDYFKYCCTFNQPYA